MQLFLSLQLHGSLSRSSEFCLPGSVLIRVEDDDSFNFYVRSFLIPALVLLLLLLAPYAFYGFD